LAGGFGPVVKDGYGIGYNIQDTMLGCVLANYKDENNGKEFLECLKEAYDEIGVILRSVA
jgi:carnitine O-palmitoyltransferase 2